MFFPVSTRNSRHFLHSRDFVFSVVSCHLAQLAVGRPGPSDDDYDYDYGGGDDDLTLGQVLVGP